jgi:hypothetical protein
MPMFSSMTASLVEDIEVSNTAAPALTSFPLKELRKSGKEWNLSLHPEHLALADAPGAQPYVIVREKVMKTAVLVEGARALVLTQPVKVTFKLTTEAVAALAQWIGEPVLARHYLKNRYGLVLPAAILWILGSLPLSGDAAAGIAALSFDPFGMALGILLAASWAWAKWRPNPVLFLVDSIWFLAMSVHLVATVMNGRSKGWLVLVPFLLWMVVKGIQHFLRFRHASIPSLTR